jgi:hypothetical protein
VEAQILKVLDVGVIPTPGTGPVPLRRGISSVRVSTLGPISVAFVILSFHYTRDLMQGLGGCHNESQNVDPPADAVGWEARHASTEDMRACEERERDRRVTGRPVKRWGMEVPPRSTSSSERLMEWGATLPPLSPPRMSPSPHRDVVPLQTGSMDG